VCLIFIPSNFLSFFSGKSSVQVAMTLEKIARAQHRLGNLDQALANLNRSYAIYNNLSSDQVAKLDGK
jgi:hypothetical protein